MGVALTVVLIQAWSWKLYTGPSIGVAFTVVLIQATVENIPPPPTQNYTPGMF